MRQTLPAMLRLAGPVILAELGWMFMGVVDTMMVGPLGPSVIGAVSVGHVFLDVIAITGIGLLLGLDTLVSQSYGAGKKQRGLRSLAVAGSVSRARIFSVRPALRLWRRAAAELAGVQPEVVRLAVPYAFSLQWSLPPLLLYAAFRRYLQGIARVRPVMFALVSANVINWLGNLLLIPDYGIEGSGWATVAARVYMAAVLGGIILRREPHFFKRPPRPDLRRIRELLRLGLPAAGQILLELGVFAMATILAGRLAPVSLAAHHVLLNIIGTTFMVPWVSAQREASWSVMRLDGVTLWPRGAPAGRQSCSELDS